MTVQSTAQLAFGIIKPKRGKARPAICAVCGKFDPDCINMHYWTATGKQSQKKARICPDCSGNPVRNVVGSGLIQIGPTTIATDIETCPMKAMLQAGPKAIKVSMPLNDLFVIGMAAHFGWAMMTRGNYKESTIRGQHGVRGYVGNLILGAQKRGVAVELISDAQELAQKAMEFVLYARRNSLVKPTSVRLEHEEKLLFVQPEVPFRITLRTLLEWAGIEWETLKSPLYDCVFQARADLVEAWKNKEGGYIVRVTDYKSFFPASEGAIKRYKKSLQLRLYGFWAAWAFGIPPQELQKVKTRILFIGEDNSGKIRHRELTPDSLPGDPLTALREVWRFLGRYHKVVNAPAQEQLTAAAKYFPPKKGDRCRYCDFRKKHCPAWT